MIVQTIGIVGCGQMGAGIAEICALSGYEVLSTVATRTCSRQVAAASSSRWTGPSAAVS